MCLSYNEFFRLFSRPDWPDRRPAMDVHRVIANAGGPVIHITGPASA